MPPCTPNISRIFLGPKPEKFASCDEFIPLEVLLKAEIYPTESVDWMFK